MKKYCMMGIDCDPDRNSVVMRWTGFDAVGEVLDWGPFALNVRLDSEIWGAALHTHYCLHSAVVRKARDVGSSVGIHFHPTDWAGRKETTYTAEQLSYVPNEFLVSVHDGWLNHESLDEQAAVGFHLNYSPAPGSHGPHYDWRDWPNRPVWWSDMLILPTQTIKTRIARSKNNVATVHPTAPPILFRRLVKAFEKTGNNTLVTYFHADEINGAIGGLRAKVYSKKNLFKNIRYLKDRGYTFQNAEEVYERFCAGRQEVKCPGLSGGETTPEETDLRTPSVQS